MRGLRLVRKSDLSSKKPHRIVCDYATTYDYLCWRLINRQIYFIGIDKSMALVSISILEYKVFAFKITALAFLVNAIFMFVIFSFTVHQERLRSLRNLSAFLLRILPDALY